VQAHKELSDVTIQDSSFSKVTICGSTVSTIQTTYNLTDAYIFASQSPIKGGEISVWLLHTLFNGLFYFSYLDYSFVPDIAKSDALLPKIEITGNTFSEYYSSWNPISATQFLQDISNSSLISVTVAVSDFGGSIELTDNTIE